MFTGAAHARIVSSDASGPTQVNAKSPDGEGIPVGLYGHPWKKLVILIIFKVTAMVTPPNLKSMTAGQSKVGKIT